MSEHYTITGDWTGQEYLVLVEARGLTVYRPGDFTLPWVGVSGARYGLSYYLRSGKDFGGPFWLADRRVRRYVARLESTARQEHQRRVRAERFAARRKGQDA